MDKEFQTSFIPKKAVIEAPKRKVSGGGGGLLNLIVFVLFLASILSAGGAYLYRSSIQSDIETYRNSLMNARAAFEPSLIEELRILDKRLNAATAILNQHVVVSPIFELLQDITLPTVRYSDFSYQINDDNTVAVSMKGEARGYNFIALQADLFNMNKFVKNPIFSDLVLDQRGNIDFSLTFYVDKTLVNYESFLNREDITSFDTQI
jgi:hypothetical protein